MDATTHEPLNLNGEELAILAELLELKGAKLLSSQYRYSGNRRRVFR